MDSNHRPMAKTITVLMWLALAIPSETSAAVTDYYRAAVVDYKVLYNNSLSNHGNLIDNVLQYGKFIAQAHDQKADIIVFPENGLLGSDCSTYLKIPDPSQKIIPVNDTAYDESIRMLAGYAQNYSIYVVVNVHENYTDLSTNTTFKYNTNVAFDRNGTVVARYRKFNLYGEPLNSTKTPEHSYFDTNFDVRFGLFTCFDILFKEPGLTLIKGYNVTNFIHTSKWFSELPFLTSVQTQWMWAVGNNVNLLAAGNNDIIRGSGGSSITRGKNSLKILATFSDQSGSTLLVGDVPKGTGTNSADDFISAPPRDQKPFPFLQQSAIYNFNSMTIELPVNRSSTNFSQEICDNNLCCVFNLEMTYKMPSSSANFQYKAVVYDGKRIFGVMPGWRGVQICGIVSCSNDSMTSCGPPALNGSFPSANTTVGVTFTSINITGNFIEDDSNILPNVLLWPSSSGEFLVSPSDVDFSANGTTTLSLKNKTIITAGIHSRVFSRDGNNNGVCSMNVSLLAMLLPCVLPFIASYMGREKVKYD